MCDYFLQRVEGDQQAGELTDIVRAAGAIPAGSTDPPSTATDAGSREFVSLVLKSVNKEFGSSGYFLDLLPSILIIPRYEKDMLAFTGCNHGLDINEEDELRIRQMHYEASHWKEKEIHGTERRNIGGCPLTSKGNMQALLDDLIFSHCTLVKEHV